MRVQCSVLDIPTGSSMNGLRSGKGAVSIGILKSVASTSKKGVPFLTVFTATGKNYTYPLDGSSILISIIDRFINQGKITIQWKEPARSIFISDARPEVLKNFVNQLKRVLKGEKLEDLKEITKEKKSDFKGQVELKVTNKIDYPKSFSSSTLKVLTLSNIGLQRIDGRWFTCTLLTSLDLSHNRLNLAPDFIKLKLLTRLVNLQQLNLSHNKLEIIPNEVLSNLPSSLLHLNVSHNLLTSIPSLKAVQSLSLLNISNNQINPLSSKTSAHSIFQLRHFPSLSLNLDNNQLTYLPYLVSRSRSTLSAVGNPLNELISLPNISTICVPRLHSLCCQIIRRSGIQLDDFYRNRFFDELSIDSCDYCKRIYATDLLIRETKLIESNNLSLQSSFGVRYPTIIVQCRRCILLRRTI